MTANPGGDLRKITKPATQLEIAGSALWHLYDYDLNQQTFALMRIEEELYRAASFLDGRIREHDCPTVAYELKHLAQMFPRLGDDRGPMGFIFHVGHCGSTLLSRALAASRRALPFREPKTLRTLSAHQRELDTPLSFMARDHWAWLLTTIIDSLARRFDPDQVNVVKATSTGNNLIDPILDEGENHTAILLYVTLETYLATMLGKGRQGGDLWTQASTRMKDWIDLAGEPGFSLYQLDPPQLAALSWLTSMNHMLNARERFGERVKMLDFDALLAQPETHLAEAATFFGLESEADSIVRGFAEVSSAYSKRPEKRYTPGTRAQLLNLTRSEHGGEIRAGLDWTASKIESLPQGHALGEFLGK